MNTPPHIFSSLLSPLQLGRLRLVTLGLLLALSLSLTGCGPKSVGEDTLKADDGYTNPAREPEEQLRYPISGSLNEQRLYYLNKPQLMVERQQKQREYFHRRLGLQDKGNDEGDLFPKRYSPFR